MSKINTTLRHNGHHYVLEIEYQGLPGDLAAQDARDPELIAGYSVVHIPVTRSVHFGLLDNIRDSLNELGEIIERDINGV